MGGQQDRLKNEAHFQRIFILARVINTLKQRPNVELQSYTRESTTPSLDNGGSPCSPCLSASLLVAWKLVMRLTHAQHPNLGIQVLRDGTAVLSQASLRGQLPDGCDHSLWQK